MVATFVGVFDCGGRKPSDTEYFNDGLCNGNGFSGHVSVFLHAAAAKATGKVWRDANCWLGHAHCRGGLSTHSPDLASGISNGWLLACFSGKYRCFRNSNALLFQLSSLRFIEASLASVLTVVEPILATILSVVLFNSHFVAVQIIGFAVVIGSVLLLTRLSDKQVLPKEERIE